MADAHARWHRRKIAEGRLAPLEKCVAFAIAFELEQRIGVEGSGCSELVHLHRVIDDQLGRSQRIDPLRIAAQRLDGIAHRGQIDDRGHAGKVLHQHAGWHVGDLATGLGLRVPVGQKLDVASGHVDAILAAQQVFQQYLQAEGQAAQVEAARGERGKAVNRVGTVAGGKRGPAGKAIHHKRPLAFLSARGRMR